MFRRLLVSLLLLATCAAWAQRVLTTPDFLAFSQRDGVGAPAINKVLPLPDGGVLLAGRFEVWYEGVRFRDLLKLSATGEPDTAWRVNVTHTAIAESNRVGIYEASLTNHGVFIVGLFEKVNDSSINAEVAYLALSTGKLINAPKLANQGTLITLSNLDPSAGYVYAHTYLEFGVQRISAASGDVDPMWRYSRAGSGGGFVNKLVADAGGALWFSSSGSSPMLRDIWTQRYRVAGLTANAESPYLQAQATISGAQLTYAVGDYVYFGTSRQRAGEATPDPAWNTRYPPSYASGKYVYFPSKGTAPEFPLLGITRAPVGGGGEPENWLLSLPAGYVEIGRQFAWPTPGDAGNLGVLMTTPSAISASGVAPPSTLALVVKEDLFGNVDPTIVEYYVPALKHYFLTGRKNEQAALDALPQSFTRTGMKFSAKSSRYRDIPEQPVCRLYASPEKGMSNSHFYGVGDDCTNLNKLTGLKYEGFDFSVLKPTGSACGADAPNGVSRLFNNKAAANDGNHRYVVSAVTKARMLAQGWVDEGAVFCSTSVVDALN